MKRLGGGPEAVARTIERAIALAEPEAALQGHRLGPARARPAQLLTDRAWDAVMRSQFPHPGT